VSLRTHEYAAPAFASPRPRWENASAMPSLGFAHHSSAAGPASATAPTSSPVLAATE
jgi:hypothetical protein